MTTDPEVIRAASIAASDVSDVVLESPQCVGHSVPLRDPDALDLPKVPPLRPTPEEAAALESYMRDVGATLADPATLPRPEFTPDYDVMSGQAIAGGGWRFYAVSPALRARIEAAFLDGYNAGRNDTVVRSRFAELEVEGVVRAVRTAVARRVPQLFDAGVARDVVRAIAEQVAGDTLPPLFDPDFVRHQFEAEDRAILAGGAPPVARDRGEDEEC